MREGPAPPLVKNLSAAGRPERGQFGVAEARADADRRIVPRYMVRANRSDRASSQMGEGGTVRFGRHEHRRRSGDADHEAFEVGSFKVMEEQVCERQVVPALAPEPVEYVRPFDLYRPAERHNLRQYLIRDDRLKIDHRQLGCGPSRCHLPGSCKRGETVTAAEFDDALRPARDVGA